jgi:hypothetical protein
MSEPKSTWLSPLNLASSAAVSPRRQRLPRHLQVAGDLLDRLALDEVLALDPRNPP